MIGNSIVGNKNGGVAVAAEGRGSREKVTMVTRHEMFLGENQSLVLLLLLLLHSSLH